MAENDLSKIVGMIMENPRLMEEIRNMTVGKKSDDTDEEKPVAAEDIAAADAPKIPIAEKATYEPKRESRRNELLRALKPYVSEERGRAIESMLTIADILTVIREK